MNTEAVTRESLDEFIAYCRDHRQEVDESYLYEEDLDDFRLGEDNPTYIVRDQGVIVAAASLILDDYHRRGDRGRFRIFHAVDKKSETYQMLFGALRPLISQASHVIVFVPDTEAEMAKAMEELDFYVERSSCFMARETDEIEPVPALPAGFELRTFRPGKDEGNWTRVRNEAFANLLGSQTPLVEDQVAKMTQEDGHLPQGMMILFHGDRAVGLVRGEDDEYEGQAAMNIGPLAILPEYQGQGLGRILLRSVIAFGKNKRYKQVVLSVNAENTGAKALYLKEGFVQVEGIRCFRFDTKRRKDEKDD